MKTNKIKTKKMPIKVKKNNNKIDWSQVKNLLIEQSENLSDGFFILKNKSKKNIFTTYNKVVTFLSANMLKVPEEEVRLSKPLKKHKTIKNKNPKIKKEILIHDLNL